MFGKLALLNKIEKKINALFAFKLVQGRFLKKENWEAVKINRVTVVLYKIDEINNVNLLLVLFDK